jgi:hypothetical protein
VPRPGAGFRPVSQPLDIGPGLADTEIERGEYLFRRKRLRVRGETIPPTFHGSIKFHCFHLSITEHKGRQSCIMYRQHL